MKTFIIAAALFVGANASADSSIGVIAGGEATHRLHVATDAAFTYAIGGYSALGVQVHTTAYTAVWNTSRATGTLDGGVLIGWQIEPQSVHMPPDPPGEYSDAKRLNTWVTVGHTLRMGRLRRASLGLHVFAGWTHVWSYASVNDDARGIHTTQSDNYGVFNAGAMLKFDYRFSKYVGFNLHAGAPFQFQPSYVATLAQVGAGLTFYLR